MVLNLPSPLQKVEHPIFTKNKLDFYIKRDDLIHPEISGNKWRKLKHNIRVAKSENYTKILTFGGAYSNHIAATAAVGKLEKIETIGIIRGNESYQNNPTLLNARENGMILYFVSREEYSKKNSNSFKIKLQQQFGEVYFIPEGGENELGVLGCEEIVQEIDIPFDYVCCDLGTGTTFSGIVNKISDQQYAIGFSVLKGKDTLTPLVKKYTSNKNNNWHITFDYNMGGFAKRSVEIEKFIVSFRKQTNIPLDPIYTGKMAYGIVDLARKGFFKSGSKIVMIHTGGLQGIQGYNERYNTNL